MDRVDQKHQAPPASHVEVIEPDEKGRKNAATPSGEAPTLADLAERQRRAAEDSAKAFEAQRGAQQADEQQGSLANQLSHEAELARVRLIREVFARSGTEIPDTDSWFRGQGPVATLRENGKVYIVVPAVSYDECGEHPDSLDQMARRCTLAVLDGPAPDLRSVVLDGVFLDHPCTVEFITREEYKAIPPADRPSAFMERSGAWYACLKIDKKSIIDPDTEGAESSEVDSTLASLASDHVESDDAAPSPGPEASPDPGPEAVIDPGPQPDPFGHWPDPMTRDSARSLIIGEMNDGAGRTLLEAFDQARSSRESALAYARLHGLEDEMRNQLRVLAELDQLATRAAALAIVARDPDLVPPRSDTASHLWPTRVLIESGCVTIGGALFVGGKYRVGAIKVCPGAVIDLDAAAKARAEGKPAEAELPEEDPTEAVVEDDETPDPPAMSLEALVAEHLDAGARSEATKREVDRLEAESLAAENAYDKLLDHEDETGREVIGVVLESQAIPLPSPDRWMHTSTPLATARVGGKLLIVTPNRDEACPTTREEFAGRCLLSVVPEEGQATTPEDEDEPEGEDEEATEDPAREMLVRAIERFDRAVDVVEDLFARKPEERDTASFKAWDRLFDLAKDDAREMESALADMLVSMVPIPQGEWSWWFEHDPRGVRYGDHVYVTVTDSVTGHNEERTIVARVPVGRMIDLD